MKSRGVSFTKSSTENGPQNSDIRQTGHQMSMLSSSTMNEYPEEEEDDDEEGHTNSMGSNMGSSRSPGDWFGMTESYKVSKVPSEHLQKYGIGAQIMMKMGYQEGKGLGTKQEGIVKPIETKLRPQGLGVGAINERTDDMEVDSSDGEIEVKRPKIDLFGVIRNLESKGVEVPIKYKEVSDRAQTEDIDSGLYQELKGCHEKLTSLDGEIDSLQHREQFLQYSIDDTSKKLIGIDDEIAVSKSILEFLKEVQSNIDEISKEEDRFTYITHALTKITDERYEGSTLIKDVFISVVYEELRSMFTNHFEDFEDHDSLYSRTIMEWVNLYKMLEEHVPVQSSHWDDIIGFNLLEQLKKRTEGNISQETHLKLIDIIRKWSDNHILIDESLGILDKLREEFFVPFFQAQIEAWTPGSGNDVIAPHFYIIEYIPLISLDKSETFKDLLEKISDKYVRFFEFGGPESLWRSVLFQKGDQGFKKIILTEVKRVFNVWTILLDRYIGKGSTSRLVKTIITSLTTFLNAYNTKYLKGEEKDQLDIVLDLLLDMLDLGHLQEKQLITLVQFTLMNHFIETFLSKIKESEDAKSIAKWFFTWVRYIKAKPIFFSHNAVREMTEWYVNTAIGHLSSGHDDKNSGKLVLPTLSGSTHPSSPKIVDKIKNSDSPATNGSKSSINVEGIPAYRLTTSFKDVVQKYCVDHAMLLYSTKKTHLDNGLPIYRIEGAQSQKLLALISEDVLWISEETVEGLGVNYEPISLDQLSQRLH